MQDFCTYFDSNYLVRFLAMYISMKRHFDFEFRVFVLCFDHISEYILKRLDLTEVIIIPLDLFEKEDKDLLSIKSSRTIIEYYFTCSPILPLYIFRHWSDVDRLTYIDSDISFYSSPLSVLKSMGRESVLIVPHRFSCSHESLEKHGIYNVSFIVFRRDKNAVECLNWWREQCINWCYDKVEGDKYADQKYLDQWEDKFSGIYVTRNKGLNVGPWNVDNYQIAKRNNKVFVDDELLIFYHFEGYKQQYTRLIDPGIGANSWRISKDIIKMIHLPYVKDIMKAKCLLRDIGCYNIGIGNTRKQLSHKVTNPSLWFVLRCYLEGESVVCFNGRGWYLDSKLFRRLFNTYDGFRNK